MTAPRHQADLAEVKDLLFTWTARQAGDDARTWLHDRCEDIEGGVPSWKFFTAFSAVPRYVPKDVLTLDDTDLSEAARAREGWMPLGWSLDEAGRALLLLSYPPDDEESYVGTIEQIFSTADVRESVALYQVLPLYPYPERFRARAAEGVRSNMTSVFNAVAHDNPYPREYFDDTAWNQMVLKALFVGSPLYKIQGLDERATPELARMLVDYAHERRAADRPVSPELWRPVGPFADGDYVDELRVALTSGDEVQREAAALALADAESAGARELLGRHPDLKQKLQSGELTWDSFSRSRLPVAA